jgi:hypothetical protein
MQVWTEAFGKTASIASGKPFRPSTTAIRMSSTPRAFRSFITLSQICALGRLDPEPEDVLRPVGGDAERQIDRLVADQTLVADLDANGVEENQRIASPAAGSAIQPRARAARR